MSMSWAQLKRQRELEEFVREVGSAAYILKEDGEGAWVPAEVLDRFVDRALELTSTS